MGWNPIDAAGDFVNNAAEVVEGAWEEGTETLGELTDDALDVLADGAELVGLDGAAEALDDFGDQISSALGGELEERQLGETSDPRELIRGEPETIGETATTLGTMADAVEQTGTGLRSIDAGDWTGEGRDGFDAAFDPQPGLWFEAADAFTDATAALVAWGYAVETAQRLAADAIAEWDAAIAEERSRKEWWNGLPTDTRAVTPLVDTWSSRYRAALDILQRARTDRDIAAERTGSAIVTAMEAAPTEPPFTSRMGANIEDGFDIANYAGLSFTDGLLTGFTGIVQFVRQVNPTDTYNLTHPADYMANMSTMATGLVVLAADPAGAVDAMLTEARANPFEFTGALTSELILSAATGGAGAARTPLSLLNRVRSAIPGRGVPELPGPGIRPGGLPDGGGPPPRAGFGDRRPGSPSADSPLPDSRSPDGGSGPEGRAGAPESARPESPVEAGPSDRPVRSEPEGQDQPADAAPGLGDTGSPPDRSPDADAGGGGPDPRPDPPAQPTPDRGDAGAGSGPDQGGRGDDPPDPEPDTYTPPERPDPPERVDRPADRADTEGPGSDAPRADPPDSPAARPDSDGPTTRPDGDTPARGDTDSQADGPDSDAPARSGPDSDGTQPAPEGTSRPDADAPARSDLGDQVTRPDPDSGAPARADADTRTTRSDPDTTGTAPTAVHSPATTANTPPAGRPDTPNTPHAARPDTPNTTQRSPVDPDPPRRPDPSPARPEPDRTPRAGADPTPRRPDITADNRNSPAGSRPPTADSHAPRTTDPDSPRTTDPDAPRTTDPDAPRTTDPDTPRTTDPDTPHATEPEPPARDTPGDPVTQRAADDADIPDNARSGDPADNRDPSQTTECGDPVDVATGEFLLPTVDLDLPGTLPLTLTRRHRSNYRHGRWFGTSWSSTFDMRLIVDTDGVTVVAEDGMLLAFPHPAPDTPARPRHGGSRWTCSRAETGTYRVHDPGREITWHFAPEPTLAGLDARHGNYAVSARTDRHRNRIRFHYAPDGAPAWVTHSGGYRVRVVTDPALARITALTVEGSGDGFPDEVVVREFAYEAGNLVAETNSTGATTRYTYDGETRLLSWTDSRGTAMRNVYDERGRVVTQHGTHGIRSAAFAYHDYPDGTGHATVHTDSLGAVTTFGFDADLRLRDLRDPVGGRTRIEYNAARDPLAVTDPDGAVTRYFYTAGGDPVRVVRPDGRSIDLVYADRNRPVRITGPDGAVRQQEWHADGTLAATIDPAGARTEFTYHPGGALASVTADDGTRTGVEVDAAGLPVAVTDPLGAVTRVRRDRFGRPVEATDPLGRSTRYRWSAEGALLSRTDPGGAVESWEYDGEGALLRERNPAGGSTEFSYGSWDLRTARTDPTGAVTRYGYDSEGRRTAIVDPLGRAWRYHYDPAGRLAAETDYNGAETTYTRTASGRIATATPATGDTRSHSYDVLGRLTGIRAESGAWRRYTYDDAGRMLSATSGHGDDLGHTLEFTYSAAGHPESETVDGSRIRRSEYDRLGRRVRGTDASGAETRWSYDGGGRPSTVGADGRVIGFAYDAAGQLTAWTVGEVAVARAFDPAGRLTGQTVVAHPEPLLDLGGPRPGPRELRTDRYTWRADDYPLTHETSGGGGRVHREFELDPVGRVTAISRDASPAERYGYDALADIVVAERAPGAVRRREYRGTLLIRDGRTRYHYDAAGRLIRKVTTRLSRKPDVWFYRYDGFDQLTDVWTPERQWWHYTYDALGRRTTKQRLATDGTVLEHTGYHWDGTRLTAQTTADAVTRWHYHPGSHTPITQTTDQPAVDREFFAIVTDLVGTPTELVDPATARTVATADADLWGRTRWTGAAATPLRFPGQVHDPETGLHYNLHRVYDPDTGRYLTPDPLGLAPAANPATYPHNPLVWSDPLGLAPQACDPRNQPGTATGGENLPHVQPGEQWLRGTHGNAGRIPGQIADVLRGQHFENFREFREAFWRAVSEHPELRDQFNPRNQTLMARGNTPFAAQTQRVGGNGQYNLHHIDPIHHGGGVYDLDNLLVVTPLYHSQILDPDFHYNR
ncbi:putative T7SS-secreted protein [Nocardia harenae]|uniref:putative T7SS-secreted protein n=1 Tax=Nocardia harenae TaxID=358707 RepID=UPI00082CC6BA|nr:DUF6531 domain-containing protein [Nocardia harenae]